MSKTFIGKPIIPEPTGPPASSTRRSHARLTPPALISLGPSNRQLGQPLCPKAHWNYSNCQSSLLLSTETTIKALVSVPFANSLSLDCPSASRVAPWACVPLFLGTVSNSSFQCQLSPDLLALLHLNNNKIYISNQETWPKPLGMCDAAV